jgi:FkbM family methyltransferase
MFGQVAASKATLLLANNPGLFFKMAFAKARTRRQLPALPVTKQINGIWFELDMQDYWGTAAMYFGSYSLVLVDNMKRYLRPGDTFIDVGANIGYMSVIGASLVGQSGQVHSFEPIPKYFSRLSRLPKLNPQYSITVNPCAAGAQESIAEAYVTAEAGQNTLVAQYARNDSIKERVSVSVIRLDDYLEEKSVKSVKLVKIDTEGYEFPVLLGMQHFFETVEKLPTIICEVGPRAYPLLGYKAEDLSRYMGEFGYEIRNPIAPSKAVDISELDHVDDVLFLPPK